MKRESELRRYGFYLACAVALQFYLLIAIRPITPSSFLLPSSLLIAFLLISKIVWRHYPNQDTNITSIVLQQRHYFLHELSIYGLMAIIAMVALLEFLAVTWLDAIYLGGVILTFGYFASMDLTLERTQRWYEQGLEQDMSAFRLHPIAANLRHKLAIALAIILFFMLLAGLKVYSSFSPSLSQHQDTLSSFFIDVVFFLAILVCLALWLTRGFAHNFHYILESQLRVLRDIQAGDLTKNVPILSQNELGLMGMQLNRLIEYIRKREKLEHLLQRVVSPDIMEKLLTTDKETLKHGEEREVAILFCDIRDFTGISEAASAEDIILFLNTFFAELSELVSLHDGIINKFMGDAILAVYGGDDANAAIDNAMRTACKITQRVQQFQLPDGSPLATGTGIHFGRVVAGTIGSEHRYEYTFLGDAVNTASRLQGLTRRLGYPIIVSADAYALLSTPLQKELDDLGSYRLRGKSDEIRAYGGPIIGSSQNIH